MTKKTLSSSLLPAPTTATAARFLFVFIFVTALKTTMDPNAAKQDPLKRRHERQSLGVFAAANGAGGGSWRLVIWEEFGGIITEEGAFCWNENIRVKMPHFSRCLLRHFS
jgi:hypothetical protein